MSSGIDNKWQIAYRGEQNFFRSYCGKICYLLKDLEIKLLKKLNLTKKQNVRIFLLTLPGTLTSQVHTNVKCTGCKKKKKKTLLCKSYQK